MPKGKSVTSSGSFSCLGKSALPQTHCVNHMLTSMFLYSAEHSTSDKTQPRESVDAFKVNKANHSPSKLKAPITLPCLVPQLPVWFQAHRTCTPRGFSASQAFLEDKSIQGALTQPTCRYLVSTGSNHSEVWA